jgi:DNA-binding response OmpR family regulator
LHYLFTHRQKVIHRDELISNVWEIDGNITTRTVDNFILRLRQKIEANPNDPHIILTVHGIGYKMVI